MRKVRENALTITLLLMVAAVGMCVYALVSVQQERSATILRACVDQNDRHVRTLTQLDAVLARAAKGASPAQRRQIYASRAPTVLLIDALAPYRDCQRVLAKSTTK